MYGLARVDSLAVNNKHIKGIEFGRRSAREKEMEFYNS